MHIKKAVGFIAVGVLVAGCGGSDSEPLSSSSTSPSAASTEVGQSVAALTQYQRERSVLAARPGVSQSAATAAKRASMSCLQRLQASLRAGNARAASRPVGCLAGVHHGKTLQQRQCTWRFDTMDAPFRFVLTTGMMTLQADAGAAAPTPIVHRVATLDAAPGEVSLEWRRVDSHTPGTTESLALTAAAQADGSDRLLETTYERAHGGRVVIERCRFAD